MAKTITINKAIKVSEELRSRGKTIVLVGGCFDIIHSGHIHFLENAKAQGDVLFVMLESDQHIKQLKGQERPINTQRDRALILEALLAVDYIILLPPFKSNKEYDLLVFTLKPAIIATTKGDPGKMHKERQAHHLEDTRVIDVIDSVQYKSTSCLLDNYIKAL